MAEQREFPHHMIKEIFEQPQALRDTIEPRILLDESTVRLKDVPITVEELRAARRINIVASGTSRHAGMAGQYMIQELAGVLVDVDYASEFEYRNPMIGAGELADLYHQSGETADTTGAQREAKFKGARTIAISNVVGSTIAREADGIIYTHAGPEISIASTKAFTCQMAALFLFALYLGQVRGKCRGISCTIICVNCWTFHAKWKSFLNPHRNAKSLPKLSTNSRIFSISAVPFITHCDGRRTKAERSFVRPRRRLPFGRNQTRTHRLNRRESSGGDHRHLRPQRPGLRCPV